MSRIVLVSNRVADLSKASQAGGVAVAIADTLRARKGLWLGWNGRIGDRSEELNAKPALAEFDGTTVATLALSSREHDDYYTGYSNNVLWPVFHSRLDIAQFEAGYYQRYLDVNKRFAQALRPLLKPDDIIWVHDYHMIPLGMELRALGVTNPIGFFLHIPVPPAQTFLAIPEHRELARGLASYDLIGLQTKVDVGNLIDYLQDGVFGRILQDGRIRAFDRELSIASFPVGIDVDSFIGSRPKRGREAPTATTRLLGVDRLDYTKGLPQKFRAFGRFLEKYPDYRRKVILSQIAPPTRETMVAYTDIKHELETLSGSINGRYGELDWVPIQYIHRATPRKMLVDVYRNSRVGFVTPLRDGMNLVAKEYVAAQDPGDPGVLILSRFAGAAEQMKEALIVNPYDVEEMAKSIKVALEMGLTERQERHQALLDSVRSNSTYDWCRSFLNALESVGRRSTLAIPTSPSDAARKALQEIELARVSPRIQPS
ncbi:alpha,alpha-trehalose-phosphate synthase [Hyphomicrobium sp. xq]|uniref:Alpha,alpha-trehalose-phosphate synthase n=1 Tax=Hyphomicrobium album TaxID=2665159 RepID=A0A6I3KK68_9HYPH|nr:trehalose-6-phosphate synthase [Hyphomicrobium album]MTD94829.1 alpha,alpha-trehalose-phosphate synthase [Hyphomicrobium album]